ncbi:MAG: hypothetical protein GY798_06915 [Hyphomicrobiales bacterium]|nr:hypothetical protein [Hyphomicrobiales bacterium]
MYRRAGGLRQAPPFFRAAALIALALSAAGCSQLGMPLGSGLDEAQAVAIGAVTDAVDPSDWEVVRQTIASAGRATAETGTLPWQNPRTGSYGTLQAKTVEPRQGGVCRAFTTTVSDIRGIRSYRGEACQREADTWQITAIVAEDSRLL